MTRTIVVVLALVVAAAGCAETTPPPGGGDDLPGGGSTGGGDEPRRAATITAVDYAFAGVPAGVAAGWVTFTLKNDGDEPHELYIASLGDMTFGEFQDLVREDMEGGESGEDAGDGNATDGADDEEAPEEGPPVPGVGGIHPDLERSATIRLEEGAYVLACWIPSPDGTPHAFKGMLAQLNVTAAEANPTPSGEDTTITIAEGNVTIAPAFTSGAHTVKAVNTGADPGEDFLGLQFVKLDANATGQDFIDAFGPNATGPPPGQAWGGLTGLPGGETAWFEVDLPAGRYAILSFDRVPRVVTTFTVA